MNSLAIAFSGPSNSGKTTLIVKVANALKDKYSLAIVKHDPSDKAIFDKEGKDSWKFSQTGAEVVVTSPTRTTLLSQKEKSIDEIIKLLGDFDILLVEGLKTLPLPRLSVFRNKLDESYFPVSNALAIDDSIDLNNYDIPKHLDILDLNDTNAIVEWILKNAKKVR
ncbi:molybdopterin-guanine dinucleotide biosynthesis protein B [Sulfurospirillum arcachonense]|uniref:molybdopterin-guanine dinucleotide biosynthesis protein B n=1 Tax=Sulfurospirillum arcachonense TaxID=57666 RepID=UPI00046A2BA8|nr:molybdopterin-guanine dinucleotide biosynthesis protein B [Sulfurospirillum arcachonense]